MAGPLDLRGRVVITNSSAATLGKVRRDLHAIGDASKRISFGTYATNSMMSLAAATNRLNNSMVGLRASLVGAGFALGGIIASTKDFNESNFGYGFARITDYIKDGKLQIDEWRAAMKRAADEARSSAKDFGTTPDRAMAAREETEKQGFSGVESDAVYKAALGLQVTEPDKIDPETSVKYLSALFRSFEKQRVKEANARGVDPNDPAFKAEWLKRTAGRTALAGSQSALGPADTVEGMRQFAAQWAAIGVPLEFALAALAHGANAGYTAIEMGTAYKSMVNRVIKPTAGGMRILGQRGVDRSKYMEMQGQDPVKSAVRLNSEFDGQLFNGKGGNKRRAEWIADIRKAKEEGRVTSPEFQQELTARALKVLGHGWSGRADQVRESVGNATMVPTGNIDLPGYLKALRDAGLNMAEMIEVFEGRHVARNTPVFESYEKMITLFELLQNANGGELIDAAVEGRKDTEAGKTDQLIASWKDMLLAIENTGIITKAKDALIGLMNAIAGIPSGVLGVATAAIVALGGAAVGLGVLGGAARIIGGLLAVAGGGAAAGAATAATGAAAYQARGYNPATLRGLGGNAAPGGWTHLFGLFPALAAGILALESGESTRQQLLEMKARRDGTPVGDTTLLPNFVGSARADELGPGGPVNDPFAAAIAAAESAKQQIESVLASINLFAAGQQAMATLAAGITAGGAQAISAANSVAAGVRAAGQRVQLNTGPNMQPAR
jgi:hypothetical protein